MNTGYMRRALLCINVMRLLFLRIKSCLRGLSGYKTRVGHRPPVSRLVRHEADSRVDDRDHQILGLSISSQSRAAFLGPRPSFGEPLSWGSTPFYQKRYYHDGFALSVMPSSPGFLSSNPTSQESLEKVLLLLFSGLNPLWKSF